MKFFNIDLHISVIEDIKDIFNDLGHQVDSKCISYHTWVLGRMPDKVDIIGQHNWKNINKELCDKFYERYKDELSDYDGFIVTHTPCFALLYERFNKPIITVASTRYEAPFTADKPKWREFDKFLQDKIDNNLIIPVANNIFDKKYVEHFTNREWKHIESLCEYTKEKYTGTKDEVILFSDSFQIDHPKIIKKSSVKDSTWKNFYSHKAAIHVPYNVSTMTMFEQRTANVPFLTPSYDYIMSMPQALGQLYYPGIGEALGMGDPSTLHQVKGINFDGGDAVKFADFYHWNHVTYFNSKKELIQLVEETDFKSISQKIELENIKRKEEVYNSWRGVLNFIAKTKNEQIKTSPIEINSTPKISLLCCTRGRTEALEKSIESVFSKAKNPNQIEILVRFDNDDVESITNFILIKEKKFKNYNIKLSIGEWFGYKKLNYYYNELWPQAEGEWLFLWNDDCLMSTDSWDEVVNSFSGQPLLLNPKHNHACPDWCVFPIIPKKWCEQVGHFSLSNHNDSWWHDIAHSLESVRHIDVSVVHDRADLTGNNNDKTFGDSKNNYTTNEYYGKEMTELREKDIQKIRELLAV